MFGNHGFYVAAEWVVIVFGWLMPYSNVVNGLMVGIMLNHSDMPLDWNGSLSSQKEQDAGETINEILMIAKKIV